MLGSKNQVSPGMDNYQNMMEVYDPEMRDDRVQTEGPHEERAYSSSASEDEDTYTRPAAHLTQATGRDEQSESDSDNVVECGDAGSSGEDETEEKKGSGAPQGLRGHSLPSPATSSTAARVDKKKPSARLQTKGRRSGTLTSTQIDHSRPSRDNSELVPSPGNPKFFKTFITAIKTDNLRAVELMCEESKKAGVDIGESKENFDDTTDTVSFTEAILAAVILSAYAVISVILLLNMLIAMMNASYDAVKMSKTKLYRYQQLSILLLIERRLFLFKWLCERSQHHIWSPKTDEHHMKNNRAKNGDDVEKGSRNSAKQKMPKMERLTSQRMYVEVTESNFEDDVRSDER